VRTTVAVRWSDEDGFGHVNNAAFLTYAEEARDRLLTHLLGAQSVWDVVIVRIEVDYRAEVTHRHERVDVEAVVEHVGRSSVRTAETIMRPDGTVAAEMRTVSVARDRSVGTSRSWTDDERRALAAPLEQTA
jgi:acyl-CoA thioester hydrolase